jgi:dCMP deaminase
MIDKWDNRFLEIAKNVSEWSKDPSSKVGAVIVKDRRIISQGYNGFPKGIKDDERLNIKEEKYPRIVHAELNAILNAAKNGVSTEGSTLYVYGLPICCDCAKSIIQSGISKVVIENYKVVETWGESWKFSKDMFDEVEIELIYKGI